MSATDLKRIGLLKYVPLIRLSCGPEYSLALCDANGTVISRHGDHLAGELDASLRILREGGFPEPTDRPGLVRASASARPVLMAPLKTANEDVGWLALVTDSGAQESQAVQAEAIEALASCVRDEYSLNTEIDGLAGELERRNEELNLVYSMDELARPTEDGENGLSVLLGKISQSMESDLAVFVSVADSEPSFGMAPGCEPRGVDLLMVELKSNLFRFASSKREGIVLNSQDEPRRRFLAPHLPFKLLLCPVLDRGEVDGMLVLVRTLERSDFLASDLHLATVIADHVGVTIRSRASIGRVKKFGDQLAGALIEAVEAKDPYTAGHSARVQAVAVHIGRQMGLPRQDLESLFWGSIMHDVGKIGIPDVILSKPGRLTEDEFVFIKTHPVRSYEILKHVSQFDSNALDAAHFHHERFDGRGYPFGLAADAIPIFARIVGVADTYDAITSSRSYRNASSHDRAAETIREVSGTQLDPDVVSAFDGACSEDPALREFILSLASKGHV